jgi:hypothetical protein
MKVTSLGVTSARFRSSELERMVDAMAPRVDEGRDKLRKATGSRK